MAGGRVARVTRTGDRPEACAVSAVSADTYVARLDEVEAILAKAFTGLPFSQRGRFYDIPELTITPAPFTRGGPPVMLAGDGVIDRDAERAAQRGKRYMIDPSLPLDEVSRLVALYDAAYTGDGEQELPLFNYGFVSDDSDPWEEMRDGFTYLRQTYDRWAGRPVREVHRDNHRLTPGNTDQLVEKVLEYHRLFGDHLHFLLRLNYPGPDPVPEGRVRRCVRVRTSVPQTTLSSDEIVDPA